MVVFLKDLKYILEYQIKRKLNQFEFCIFALMIPLDSWDRSVVCTCSSNILLLPTYCKLSGHIKLLVLPGTQRIAGIRYPEVCSPRFCVCIGFGMCPWPNPIKKYTCHVIVFTWKTFDWYKYFWWNFYLLLPTNVKCQVPRPISCNFSHWVYKNLTSLQGWPCVLKHFSQIDDFRTKYREHRHFLS
jgi:hypothetical protein